MPMATKDLSFYSGPKCRLAARLYLPEPERDRKAGIVFCHGFGGAKEGTPPGLSTLLAKHGYTVLTFDYRGFGASEGARGRLVPSEQVEDAVHALALLSQKAGLDPKRIGVYGTSFGGGIAIMAARRSGIPSAAVVTVPVTSGSQWLQSIMRWHEFMDLKKRAIAAIASKAASGEMQMVDRFDIMIPDPTTQARYTEKVPLALETFHHVLNHEPMEDAAHLKIPVAVIGVRGDPLVPVDQAIHLHERLGGIKQLHLLDGGDHFVVYEQALTPVAERAIAWFDTHLAAQ
jgi:pimeloyl-ACP methyl ester carboxylesterase